MKTFIDQIETTCIVKPNSAPSPNIIVQNLHAAVFSGRDGKVNSSIYNSTPKMNDLPQNAS
jgi:hypothetical protein